MKKMVMKSKDSSYRLLAIMAVVHLFFMYIFMYFMADRFSNVFPNINQFYMAALMTAPMLILELFLMGKMYPDKKRNILLIALILISFVMLFIFIRQQVAVSDKQFLKSMIPHHSSALLMCEKADLSDPQIIDLCNNITASQQSEIDWMKNKLDELNS